MATTEKVSTRSPVPSIAWHGLVDRSIAAWDSLTKDTRKERNLGTLPKQMLLRCKDLNDMLQNASNMGPMLWFFQTRQAFMQQKRLTKWSTESLEDYIIIPASPGYVNRRDCFFLSHFWLDANHPDSDGTFLRLTQESLKHHTWSYIWVDWTCAPQSPRTELQQTYFRRCLTTMPAIISESGFAWHYPPYQPRLWILYEVAQCMLTSSSSRQMFWEHEDMAPFAFDISMMIDVGTREWLEYKKYKCSDDKDKEYLLAWLEFLILINHLGLHIVEVRRIIQNLVWMPLARTQWMRTTKAMLEIRKFDGKLRIDDREVEFTPFPSYDTGIPSLQHDTVQ